MNSFAFLAIPVLIAQVTFTQGSKRCVNHLKVNQHLYGAYTIPNGGMTVKINKSIALMNAYAGNVHYEITLKNDEYRMREMLWQRQKYFANHSEFWFGIVDNHVQVGPVSRDTPMLIANATVTKFDSVMLGSTNHQWEKLEYELNGLLCPVTKRVECAVNMEKGHHFVFTLRDNYLWIETNGTNIFISIEVTLELTDGNVHVIDVLLHGSGITMTENSYENTVNVTAPKIWLALVNGHLDVGIGRILHDVKVVSQIDNIASIVEVYIASNKNDIDLDGVACPTDATHECSDKIVTTASGMYTAVYRVPANYLLFTAIPEKVIFEVYTSSMPASSETNGVAFANDQYHLGLSSKNLDACPFLELFQGPTSLTHRSEDETYIERLKYMTKISKIEWHTAFSVHIFSCKLSNRMVVKTSTQNESAYWLTVIGNHTQFGAGLTIGENLLESIPSPVNSIEFATATYQMNGLTMGGQLCPLLHRVQCRSKILKGEELLFRLANDELTWGNANNQTELLFDMTVKIEFDDGSFDMIKSRGRVLANEVVSPSEPPCLNYAKLVVGQMENGKSTYFDQNHTSYWLKVLDGHLKFGHGEVASNILFTSSATGITRVSHVHMHVNSKGEDILITGMNCPPPPELSLPNIHDVELKVGPLINLHHRDALTPFLVIAFIVGIICPDF
ncbi:hypothetical protein CAPTEDRAFT_197704 [Capitella teleta]|uniref:Uncharacterized protein n=1 Tax=Capitella teleta TaxID=283909 RepID=R7VHK8_CAPTE|nr:hypothetical protein CAPTEDRAFT_197704 [Capitella teleta]|eukprot:ELU18062.1 hypothetical protein CAPTEDRAFT_197704 [Capitella teleta]